MNIREWKPHKKQAEFLALPTSITEAFYGGGAGSAKTETLLVYSLVRGWYKEPRFKQVFLRRTFPELRNEVVPRSRELFRPFKATFNTSQMAWTFPREDQYGSGMQNAGAMIFLGHCEHDDDVHKYDSMEINLFTPDELTSFSEWIYTYISFQRVRTPTGTSLPSIIRGAGMPGGMGHTWVKKRFIDDAPNGSKIIVGKGGIKRIFIHATQADNPYIDPEYKNKLEALSEAEKKAKKFGDWNAYLGQVFDEFRDKNYTDEPEEALHVIDQFDIPEWWPRIVALDWGYAAMTWVGFGAISPNGRLYVYRELYWKKTKIEEWASILKGYLEKENVKVIRVCRSASQDRGQDHTIQQQIEVALDRRIELSANTPGSRIAGKALIHEYLRWKKKHVPEKEQLQYNQDHAMWLLRNKGQTEYNDYLTLFKAPLGEDNLPKLQIFNSCSLLIDTIKACTYAGDKKDQKAEDVAEFDGDDPYDGLRYLVDTAERYFDESSDEFKRIQKRDELIAKFSENNDMTAFYRNARRIDEVDSVMAVRRYH